LAQLQQGISLSRLGGHDAEDTIEAIAPSLISRIGKTPDDPSAAALLTYICSRLSFDSKTEEPPPHFTEIANLVVARYATSSRINNFCESLGGLHFSPHWASEFESHLRSILEVNKDRWVRCTASMALASVVQLSVDRQPEAEELYEKFLLEFDGQHEYMGQNVESVLHARAEQRLRAMQFAPLGSPAPEIIGVDLSGEAMKLSDYRGKVVLMSYWATWCFPCMKFIQHERELATHLADEPFVIVGVNGDRNEQQLAQAVTDYQISWRSFRDLRPGQQSISDEWTAFYPTLYLIDHEGIVRKRWTGTPPPEVLGRLVEELVEAARADASRNGRPKAS
jgi:peroxiredoxin